MTTLLKNKRGESLMDQWDYVGPRHLAIAIATVHREMHAAGEKPGSEKWTNWTAYREKIINRIVSVWANVAEQDPAYFPFSADVVCDRWIWYRKLAEEDKAAWNDYLQLGFAAESA